MSVHVPALTMPDFQIQTSTATYLFFQKTFRHNGDYRSTRMYGTIKRIYIFFSEMINKVMPNGIVPQTV